MPNSPIAEQAMEAAKALGDRITDLSTKVETLSATNEELTKANKRLAQSNTRHRNWIIALGALGCLVAAVVVGLVIALVKVDEANDKAVKASDVAGLVQKYQVEGCEAGNASRALEKAIWDTLFAKDKELAKESGEPITAEEQKALDQVAETIRKAYPQRDCESVKEGVVKDVAPTPTVKPAISSTSKPRR